jgi:mannose/fructose/N-acetylgalactosamine-specific phosphotransferase system component IIB
MQLRTMKYAKIEGTEVMVQVSTPTEAKAAIKELRHRKKELGLLKKRLVRQSRDAQAALDKKEAAQSKKIKKGGLTSFATRISRVLSRSPGQVADLATIESDLRNLEQVTHNIESCILQIEGRLLV